MLPGGKTKQTKQNVGAKKEKQKCKQNVGAKRS